MGAGVEQRVAQQLVDLCDAALEELPPSAAMTTAASTEDALSDPSDPSGSSDAASEAQRRERSAARVLLGERQAHCACAERDGLLKRGALLHVGVDEAADDVHAIRLERAQRLIRVGREEDKQLMRERVGHVAV